MNLLTELEGIGFEYIQNNDFEDALEEINERVETLTKINEIYFNECDCGI